MLRFNHVNLGVPVGGREAQEVFLLDVLGYRRVDQTPEQRARLLALGDQLPPEVRQRIESGQKASIFESEDGTQIHLSEDPDHRPAAKAHVAIDVGADLADLEAKLDQAGLEHLALESEGDRVVFCQDPAGNRWELRGTLRA